MPTRMVGIGMPAAALLAALALPVAASAAEPVRVSVHTTQMRVETGAKVAVKLGLQDSHGQPVAAPKDFILQVQVKQASGKTESLEIPLKAGADFTEADVTAEAAGLLEIAADHAELRAGGAFVQVAPAGRSTPSPRLRELPQPNASRAPRPEPPPTAKELPGVRPAAAPGASGAQSGRVEAQAIPGANQPSRPEISEGRAVGVERVFPPPGPPPPPPLAPEPPRLILRASPAKDLLANDKDSATIFAFLQENGGAAETYRVQLVPDGGRLEPQSLDFPPGKTSATAQLTSSNPGTIHVEDLGASPELAGADPPSLQVQFEPPITGLELASNPESVSPGIPATVVAQLVGADGRPLATNRDREVTFSVRSGPAHLGETSVTIPEGGFEAKTQATGEWWGDTEITASSPGFLNRTAPLKIAFPWALLAVLTAGSLAGGFIAWTYGKGRRKWLWQRLFTGLIAGVVFYWLLLFTGIVPRAALLNPLGVFAVAVLGGWLGTSVFDLALDKLGLRKAPEPG